MKNFEKHIILLTFFAVISSFLATSLLFYFFGESFRDFALATILSVGLPLVTAPIIINKYLSLLEELNISNEKLDKLQEHNNLTNLYTHDHALKLAKKNFLMAQKYNLNYSISIFDLKKEKNIDSEITEKDFLKYSKIIDNLIKNNDIIGHLFLNKLILFSPFATHEIFTDYIKNIKNSLDNEFREKNNILSTISSFTISYNVEKSIDEIIGHLIEISEHNNDQIIKEYK